MMDELPSFDQLDNQMRTIQARMTVLRNRNAQFIDYNYMGMVGLQGGI